MGDDMDHDELDSLSATSAVLNSSAPSVGTLSGETGRPQQRALGPRQSYPVAAPTQSTCRRILSTSDFLQKEMDRTCRDAVSFKPMHCLVYNRSSLKVER
ncbi:hypothetical protein H2248_004064 [Termitomyces sp. 'cryptogamus']|nr:hypothetical protein H2248_004064 [Termitomyces sp. 'cryptogamus']